jgi:hypothetical protein
LPDSKSTFTPSPGYFFDVSIVIKLVSDMHSCSCCRQAISSGQISKGITNLLSGPLMPAINRPYGGRPTRALQALLALISKSACRRQEDMAQLHPFNPTLYH